MATKTARIGFHASHEQFTPGQLLRSVVDVSQTGCRLAMCSDHFAPWSERQGHSGYTWSWLGSALEATKMEFGTVSAPGQRYHPAILAQKIATVSEMYPGRLWLALGSGELINEHVTGEKWPAKAERNQRLLESVKIIRSLLAGETVSHEGLVRVDRAKLATLPSRQPLLLGAALTEATAEWAGSWADGLITVGQDYKMMEKIIAAFRRGGGEGKPLYLQEQISFTKSREEALASALDQWRFSAFSSSVIADIALPKDLDEVSKHVREEDVVKSVKVSAQYAEHRDWLQRNVDMGFDRIYLHNVCRERQDFFAKFAENVFPAIKGLEL